MAVQRRNTHQRQLVLDAVIARSDHPTAEEIYHDVRAHDEKISRGTVYRNLNLLEEAGAIRSVHVPGGNRFDRRIEDHAHVTCLICGSVQDAPLAYDDAVDARAAAETGYDVESHSTVFYGICPACQRKQQTT
ncbi:Fur family transcriptional regulator [Collinsella vaginalis]|uniref:Fur family transcriptional regulator n=1 Tax=Collinsella vaginalis TaxID=1870987 RepID=UPI001FE6D6FF|nr:transcriptional repressor [Collinsella vaginalis]